MVGTSIGRLYNIDTPLNFSAGPPGQGALNVQGNDELQFKFHDETAINEQAYWIATEYASDGQCKDSTCTSVHRIVL